MFFCAPNNMFAYMIVHLRFHAPEIVIHTGVYANFYLTMHLLERQKYFRAKCKLKAYSTHHQPRP